MDLEITTYAEFIEHIASDSDWLSRVTHAAWDVDTDMLTFRFPEGSDPRDGFHTFPVAEVEKDYPVIRQALRVANVTGRTDRARGGALASWSHLLGSGLDVPFFFFKKQDGASTALGLAWATRLKHIDMNGSGIDLHIAVASENPTGAFKTAHPGYGFGNRVANANFPGITKAVRRALDLGMSTSEAANYVKREIIGKCKDTPVALPELQP